MQIEELNHCPFAEELLGCNLTCCRYAAFRINGRVEVIDGSNPNPEKLQVASVVTLPPKKKGPFVSFMALLYYKSQREKLWFASSIKSRLQYLGPNLGIPCLSEQSPDEFLLGSSSGPVTTFCLLVLEPDQVDYLNLKSNQRIVPPSNRVPMEKCAGIQG
uniref:Uncharacterized protein n=1 Tax=Salix viminalis TaxID=40686 RepID=A0A6N2KZD4_SALVM